MNKEARRQLRLWAKRGFIVYLRIYYLDNEYWWALQVEGGPKVLTERGQNLSEVIETMAPQVPKKPMTNIPKEGWIDADKPKKGKRK